MAPLQTDPSGESIPTHDFDLESMPYLVWRVVNLHPNDPAITDSFGFAIHGRQQVGHVQYESHSPRAGKWTSSASSYRNLHPPEQTISNAFGICDGHVAGMVGQFSTIGAVRWATSTDMQIPAPVNAVAYAQGDRSTGGMINDSAVVWDLDGIPKNLHPPGMIFSRILGVHKDRQVGLCVTGLGVEAYLWNGTVESAISIHPADAHRSQACGVYGNRQVGHVGYRACLWRDSAGARTDLHPSGYSMSMAQAAHRQSQAGYATKGGWEHAGVWRDTATSWEDLHDHLPSHFKRSVAYGIWTVDDSVSVIGWGYNDKHRRGEAFLWLGKPPSGPVPRPQRFPRLPTRV